MKIIKTVLMLVLLGGFFSGVSFAQTALVASEGESGNAKPAVGVVVPENCAAFVGAWVGKWDYSNYGEMRLHVSEVGANCIAKGSYGASDSPKPWPFEGAEISGDKLSWLCSKARGGTCVFEYHGDTLWARYHDPSGGRNNGVFKKVAK